MTEMTEKQPILWIARRVVLEMLGDRGYAVDAAEVELSEADFAARFGGSTVGSVDLDALNFSATLRADPARRVHVIFFDGSRRLGEYPELRARDRSMSAVIVSLDDMQLRPSAGKFVEQLFFGLKTDVFMVDELPSISPKRFLKGLKEHELLTSEEMRDMFDRGIVKEDRIVRLTEDCIFARYYGLRVGEAVRIVDDLSDLVPAEGETNSEAEPVSDKDSIGSHDSWDEEGRTIIDFEVGSDYYWVESIWDPFHLLHL